MKPVLWLVLIMFLGIAGYLFMYITYNRWNKFLLALIGIVSFEVTILWLFFDFYYFHWYDDWAWLLEVRSWKGIEFSSFLIGVFCGLVQRNVNKKLKLKDRFSRHNGIVLILIIVLPPFIKPVLYPVHPKWENTWDIGVCLQTTPYTCGPASTATVLNFYGVRRSEQEISRNTWLTKHGTEPWHLARYLRQNGFKAKFISVPNEPGDLPIPCIVGVRIDGKKGKGHFLTILEKTENTYTFGDPAVGRVKLSKEETFSVYYFVGFIIHVVPDNP